MRDLKFEEMIKTLPEYKTLIFQHGERLFIRRDGEYEILAIRLAYRIHCMAMMTCLVVDGDGVLRPDGTLLSK